MDIHQKLSLDLGQQKSPKTLGEVLTTVTPLLPESVVSKIQISWENQMSFKVTLDEIKEINRRYWNWRESLPKPIYVNYRSELKHWLSCLRINSGILFEHPDVQ